MSLLSCLSLSTLSPAEIPERTVLCLGNFDGVHIAHRALIRRARAFRDASLPQASLAVLCFAEPPSAILSPNTPPSLLCTQEDKLSRLRECGAEYVILADFASLRDTSWQDFAEQILLEECHAAALACGFNYRCGRNALGTPELLRERLSLPLLLEEEICMDGETVSSTRIRRLLSLGQIEKANALLGTPFTFAAEVLHGKALGRSLGLPTANQDLPKGLCIPRHGVYASSVTVDGKVYAALSNVGVHPTVDRNAALNCETYILGFDGDLYEKTIRVSFLHWVRPEMTFASKEALMEQMQTDLALAKTFFAKHPLTQE